MSLSPTTHRCNLPELSYEQVDDGTIWCRHCGRVWDLTEWGWKPDPPPPRPRKPWRTEKNKR